MKDVIFKRAQVSDTGWLVERHQEIYAREEGFDATFGPLVKDILDRFFQDHDPENEAGWIAWQEGQRLGSIFCVDAGKGRAKLRLFLLVPQARGLGLGQRMLNHCMAFARGHGYAGMTLWTHAEHRAACRLYATSGWHLSSARAVRSFGVDLTEQEWRIDFD